MRLLPVDWELYNHALETVGATVRLKPADSGGKRRPIVVLVTTVTGSILHRSVPMTAAETAAYVEAFTLAATYA